MLGKTLTRTIFTGLIGGCLVGSQARLVGIAQPIAAEAVLRFHVDGALIARERRVVRIRAINDAPLISCRKPQQCTDYSPSRAA